MKIKIRIISSYQSTKETERRLDRLASLMLENSGKENIANQKDERLHKSISKDIFS